MGDCWLDAACESTLVLLNLRGLLLAEAGRACVDDDNNGPCDQGLSIVVLPLLLVGVAMGGAMGGAAEEGGVW